MAFPANGSSPRRLPRAEREQQILDAAHEQFAERGFAAVTMDGVAAAVGVTKPLLYNYWGNKDRLYLACLEREAERLRAAVGLAVAEAASPADALNLATHAFFAYIDTERGAFRVLFDETLPAQRRDRRPRGGVPPRARQPDRGHAARPDPGTAAQAGADGGRGPVGRAARRRRGARRAGGWRRARFRRPPPQTS